MGTFADVNVLLCSFNCIFPSFLRYWFLHIICLIDMQIIKKAVDSFDVDMSDSYHVRRILKETPR